MNFIRLSIAIGIMISTTTINGADVEIIGHRGASYDAPENTLAAVKLSWEQAADATEFDVYLSKDNHIVGIHDETTKRTAGGRDIPVVSLTLDELRKLDAGGWKNAKYKGEKIPTLSELLASIPNGKRVFIEVKCGPEIVPVLKRDIAESGKNPNQTAIISFSYEVCQESKRAMPELAVYWIVGLKQDEQTQKWSPNLDDMIAKAQAAKLDGLDLGKAPIIDRAYASKIRNAGLGLYVWTVDDPVEAKRLIDAGVQGVTTNRPGWMREQLSLEK